MKALEFNQMEIVEGGGVVQVVNGACAAVSAAGIFGWIALNNPVGYVVGGVCLVNTVGQGMDWW